MDLTPACVEAVIAASPLLQWLHGPENVLTILLLLLAEVLIHVFIGWRLLGGMLSLGSWLLTQGRKTDVWCHYRRLPLQGRVMCDWYGHGIWGIARAKVWVHQGRMTGQCPHEGWLLHEWGKNTHGRGDLSVR